MDRGARAKQFIPFDAMKGLREALKKQEELLMKSEKRELSEETAEELSRCLSELQRGDEVRVTFHRNGFTLEKLGYIQEFDPIFKYMKIDDEKIFFTDVYSVTKV